MAKIQVNTPQIRAERPLEPVNSPSRSNSPPERADVFSMEKPSNPAFPSSSRTLNATKPLDSEDIPEVKGSLDRLLSTTAIDLATHRLVLAKVQILGFSDVASVESHVRNAALQLNKLSSVEKAALSLSGKSIVIVADDAKAIWDDARDGRIDGQSIQSKNLHFIEAHKANPDPKIAAAVARAEKTNQNLDGIFSINNGYHSENLIVVKASKVLSPEKDNDVIHPTLLHEVGHALVDLAAEQSDAFSKTLDLNNNTHVQPNAHKNDHFMKNNSEYLAAAFAKYRYEGSAPSATKKLFEEMQGHLIQYVRENRPAPTVGR